MELETSIETSAARTGITFSCLLNMSDNVVHDVLESDYQYSTTFGYQGDISEELNAMECEDLGNYEFVIQELRRLNPDFNVDLEKNYISLIGTVKEITGTDGDWETGYFTILVFQAEIISYEVVPKEDYDCWAEKHYGDFS